MPPEFHREYLVRLPLPLAQLYSRAHNAKNARSRHDNIFYLFEALTKLTAAPAIMAYLQEVRQGAPRDVALDRLLAQLALPSLGQWVAMVRELARSFGQRPDAASHPLGHLWEQLRQPRRDRPGLLALYRHIKNGPDGAAALDQSCSPLQVIESLVQYRNAVFGHGAGRFDSFYEEEMGPLLFPAANDLLAEGVLDLLGPRGSRLVYLTEIRTVEDGRVEVGLRELVGLQGERLAPLSLTAAEASGLLPNRVAVLWPGRPTPLPLDPLLAYRESELADELLFLNRDRDGRQVEYLSYTTGRTERDRNTAPALAALLSLVANRKVDEADLQALADRSRAEGLPDEGPLLAGPPAARQLGDYDILAEIGRGGMGVVYLARQRSLGRLVALKTLPAETAGDEVAVARFRREIRHLARCEHPNIVKVLTSGTLPDGQLYYTMEHVPGSNLELVWRELSGLPRASEASTLGGTTWTRAVLSATRKQREQTVRGQIELAEPGPEPPPLPDDAGGYVRRIAGMGRDAALALQAVHDQGIVHRDVKPANLMLTPDGSRVVLMDFGLAKGQSLTMAASRAGGFLGTLRYAAPEQLAAATLKVGPEADVRALGVTLWELLTRRRLFDQAQDERQLASLIYECDVPPLRSVDRSLDRDLEAIVARATERRVADRIATARELADYLTLYLAGKPLPIRPPTTRELLKRWVLRHKPLVASVTAATIVVLVTTVTAFVLITAALTKSETARLERALGQVDALLDANPEAIPDLVNGLELDRPEVLARLQELSGADRPRGQRLRAALALLRIDPDRVSDLQRDLLQTDDAREMLVIRDALKPHAPQLREPLWALVQDSGTPAQRKFLAAVALAAFAPDDPRWADLGRQIVDPLLSADLRDLGLWIGALEPVWENLRQPLTDVFARSDQPAMRVTAARILAEYAAGQPAVLADLAADADPRQFAILLPVLLKQRDGAATWLGKELDRLAQPPEPKWSDSPPDPSWGQPEPALVQKIEQGDGLLTERFALCQTMTLEQFLAVAEALRRFGYRPTCFRPYAVGKAVQVAAVWARDWRDWHLAPGATAEEIAKQDAEWRKRGYWPRDVAGYQGTSGGKAVEQYAALWTDPEPGVMETRLLVGVADSAMQATGEAMQKAGLLARTHTLFPVGAGQRYAGVFWKPERMPDLRWSYVASEEAVYESLLFPSNWQVDVRVDRAVPPLAPRQRYGEQLGRAEEIVTRTPEAVPARLARGYLYFCLGRDEPALADLDFTLAKAPQEFGVYFYRALARARLGRAAEARQDLAAYQKQSGNAGENLALEVAVSAFLGEDAAAVARLEAALAGHGEDSSFLYYAACAYAAAAPALAARQPDRSRAYADRAVALLRQVADGGYVGNLAFMYTPLTTQWALDGLWSHPGYQELLRQGHLDRHYSAAWYDNSLLESAEAHGLGPADHLRRCRELAAGGYRPASISVAWLGDGQPPATASVWHRPIVADASIEARARRQAQAAVALLQLRQPERVWPLLRHSEDPRVRTHLIHRFAPLELDPQTVIGRLHEEPDVSARRALILGLGEFAAERVPADARASLIRELVDTYRTDSDAGLHGAVDWLLRRWGQSDTVQEIDRGLRRRDPDGAQQWYVNKEGQTLAVIRDPPLFWMGSPAGEPGRSINSDTRFHQEYIPRSFAIATREVTLPQFRRFLLAHPEVSHGQTTTNSPDPDGAAIDVTWFEAAQYCNWLSQEEGIPDDQWCFLPNADKKFADGMQMRPGYLALEGYRLPTMAEWEYACRAARTGCYYGTSKELLANYAVYGANSEDHAWSGGRLKPNDFGLFDMLGNVLEWTQDYRGGVWDRGSHGQPHVDRESLTLLVRSNDWRETRGGSFMDPAPRLRASYEGSEQLTHVARELGFRVARTIRKH